MRPQYNTQRIVDVATACFQHDHNALSSGLISSTAVVKSARAVNLSRRAIFTGLAVSMWLVTVCGLPGPLTRAQTPGGDSAVPADFPSFVVPGHEQQMDLLRELYWLHYQPAGPLIPLWDEWMPMATLWPARGTGVELPAMRKRWAKALAGRIINAEGYVHTQQHDGPAHAEGWPFPLWTQAGGIGWHFRTSGGRRLRGAARPRPKAGNCPTRVPRNHPVEAGPSN